MQRYVCISSRGPLPPLDLELYSRVSQVAKIADLGSACCEKTDMDRNPGCSTWKLPSCAEERPGTSRRAAAGRAELLAKKVHTGHVQNPVKVSENRPACGTAQHTLAVCFVFEKLEKSRKFWLEFGENSATFWQIFGNFCENLEKISKNFSNF